jgi:hypothetical protein
MRTAITATIGTLALAAGIGLSACGGGSSGSTAPGPPAGATPSTHALAASQSAAPSSQAMFDWEDSPNISPNNIGPYLDHLASILPAQDTTAIAQLRQLANMGSALGDLDNTTVAQTNTAKANALALDNFFGKYGGSGAAGIMPHHHVESILALIAALVIMGVQIRNEVVKSKIKHKYGFRWGP